MPNWHDCAWKPELNWESAPGRLLRDAVRFLFERGRLPASLTIFGSSPLEMGVDSSFLSADVDLASGLELEPILRAGGFLKGQRTPFLEISPPQTFVAAIDWQSRAHVHSELGCNLIFPHPIDILVSKIPRAAAKDVEAFRAVRDKTGHPTEEELVLSLRRVVDMYRPRFDEEAQGDAFLGTSVIWTEVYGREIDVREEVIRPALAARRLQYEAEEAEKIMEGLRSRSKKR